MKENNHIICLFIKQKLLLYSRVLFLTTIHFFLYLNSKFLNKDVSCEFHNYIYLRILILFYHESVFNTLIKYLLILDYYHNNISVIHLMPVVQFLYNFFRLSYQYNIHSIMQSYGNRVHFPSFFM